MKNKPSQLKFMLLLLSALLSSAAFSQTITVKQDGTGGFTTIQAAVDSAENGDTVLVWPGIYFENINFNGKNIVLGSLLLTTGDESYKYTTIIDGDNKGSCVLVNNSETNAELTGFTLQHGSGNKMWWDTTFIQGGGVLLDNVTIEINNCLIKNNKAGHGGGIYCYNHSSLTLSKVTITNNYVTGTGGGLSIAAHANVTFDSVNRCNIYLNYAVRGNEIHKVVENDTLHVYLDTCTVLEPDYHFFSSIQIEGFYIDDIVYDIQHAKLTPVDADLYVNPVTGNDSASGLSANEPLKTIAYAYSKIAVDSNERNTIHLANGVYSDSTNGEKFPLNLRSYINLMGESREGAILDGRYKTDLLEAYNEISNMKFSKLTLQRGRRFNPTSSFPYNKGMVYFYRVGGNITFDSVLFTKGIADRNSAVVTIGFEHGNLTRFTNCIFTENLGLKHLLVMQADDNDTLLISNCIFSNNKTNLLNPYYQNGKTIEIYNGTTIVLNSLFLNNDDDVFDFYYEPTHRYFVNCTFSGNSFLHREPVLNANKYETRIYNSIFYNNGGNYNFVVYASQDTNITLLKIYNSLIENGIESINTYDYDSCYYYDTSNIDTNPLFYNEEDSVYSLSAESPCIDAGTMDLPKFILDRMPATDLAGNPRIYGNKIDMGALEWNNIGINEKQKSKSDYLSVFPNPFSSQTIISTQLINPARISTEIYNSAGLLIKTLQSGSQPAGSCQIQWNGTDNSGHYLPTGVYVVVLRVDGKEVGSVKVVKE